MSHKHMQEFWKIHQAIWHGGRGWGWLDYDGARRKPESKGRTPRRSCKHEKKIIKIFVGDGRERAWWK